MKKKFLSAFLTISFFINFTGGFTSSCATNAFDKERPKVSIIVPVYNTEPWLRECMDSLVNQTLKEIEIICVDDGSPDNCGKILDEYAKKDTRIIVIHQKNQGVSAARNAGLNVASGEYITFVDSDDYVDLNTYEKMYNLAKKDEIDILQFKFRRFQGIIGNKNSKIRFSDSAVLSLCGYLDRRVSGFVFDKLFKYDLIKDKVKFPVGIQICEDTCFGYTALGMANRIKIITATCYNYRKGIRNSLSDMSPDEAFIKSHKIIKIICDNWRRLGCVKRKETYLLRLIIDWTNRHHKISLRYAQEILDALGSDICTQDAIKNSPKITQNEIKKLKNAAKSARLAA